MTRFSHEKTEYNDSYLLHDDERYSISMWQPDDYGELLDRSHMDETGISGTFENRARLRSKIYIDTGA